MGTCSGSCISDLRFYFSLVTLKLDVYLFFFFMIGSRKASVLMTPASSVAVCGSERKQFDFRVMLLLVSIKLYDHIAIPCYRLSLAVVIAAVK